MCETRSWFAIKVRDRFERNIAEALAAKDIEVFMPTYSVHRRWSDRNKILTLPLFAGYLFCRIDPEHRLPVLMVPGVHYFVGIGKTPESVADSEIDSLQALVRSGANLLPRPYLAEGQRVRIEDGPMQGAEGVLLRVVDEDHLVISIDLLQRSVAVTIHGASVTPVEAKRNAPRFESHPSAHRAA